MSHGYSCDFWIADEEGTFHGASYILEILVRSLARVKEIRARQGLPMVRHLCVQSDNTVAACKNSEVSLFMGVVARRFGFDTTNVFYLRKGHTHEDVDFVFSLLLARVLRRIRIHTPLDLVQGIHAGMESLLASKGYQCYVEHITHVRDFNQWLGAMGIKPYNCFANRRHTETPHSFTWKFRMDLSREEVLQTGNSPFEVHPLDIFCICKQFMADRAGQPPVLMIPNCRYVTAALTPAPTRSIQLQIDDKRKKQLRQMANLLEQLSADWSADHSFYRAAAELRVMANGRPQVPSRDGFLESMAAIAADHQRRPLTLNVWHPVVAHIGLEVCIMNLSVSMNM